MSSSSSKSKSNYSSPSQISPDMQTIAQFFHQLALNNSKHAQDFSEAILRLEGVAKKFKDPIARATAMRIKFSSTQQQLINAWESIVNIIKISIATIEALPPHIQNGELEDEYYQIYTTLLDSIQIHLNTITDNLNRFTHKQASDIVDKTSAEFLPTLADIFIDLRIGEISRVHELKTSLQKLLKKAEDSKQRTSILDISTVLGGSKRKITIKKRSS